MDVIDHILASMLCSTTFSFEAQLHLQHARSCCWYGMYRGKPIEDRKSMRHESAERVHQYQQQEQGEGLLPNLLYTADTGLLIILLCHPCHLLNEHQPRHH
jgi:hypothetical protein